MSAYTFFIRESGDNGTTFINCVEAASVKEAARMALDECAAAWSSEVESLRIMGVAEGDVRILEWSDFGQDDDIVF